MPVAGRGGAELGVERDHDGRHAHEDGADRRRQRDADPGEDAGGERDRDDVVAGGPGEVLDHLPVARLREADDADHAAGSLRRARRRRTRWRRRCRRRSRCRRRHARARERRSRRRRPSPPSAPLLQVGDRGSLSSGSTSANTSSMPRSAATASATCCASPVIIATRTPICCRSVDRLHATRGGPRPRGRTRPTTCLVAARRAARGAALPPSRDRRGELGGDSTPRSRTSAGPPTASRVPSTWPRRRGRAAPGSPRRRGRAPLRSRAAATIARASGCSLSDSTAAASVSSVVVAVDPRRRPRRSPRARPSSACPSCRTAPCRHVRIRSSASRSWTRMPARAATRSRSRYQRDRQAERVRARDHQHGDGAHDGVARCPQQRPDHERHRAGANRDVEQQRSGAVGERLRARRDACASATRRWMPANAVSSPTRSTRTRSAESVATVPATTRSPSPSPPAATRR